MQDKILNEDLKGEINTILNNFKVEIKKELKEEIDGLKEEIDGLKGDIQKNFEENNKNLLKKINELLKANKKIDS